MQINDFIIFHPSTQYEYKVYPLNLRNKLVNSLSNLGVPIIITGGNSYIDREIKNHLPKLPNVYDFIGETSIEEFIALSEMSSCYIGMDTLNMHIAASQDKKIFAIFGPTNLKMWSPWSNKLKSAAAINQPIQTYGNVTIFQADMPCVACGKAGCNDNHKKSNCLYEIDPNKISNKVSDWISGQSYQRKNLIELETSSTERKILLYIIYGEDQGYYDGAIFSFLTFKYWENDSNKAEVVILTEKPDKFEDYPVNVLQITQEQMDSWSLGGRYHFRIKNRGMAFVIDQLNLNEIDKILFLDADTYFNKSPFKLFELINQNQALFYLNEGLIYNKKRFAVYVDNLENKKIKIDNEIYQLSKSSSMWGSLMVGLMVNMRSTLDWSDKLLVELVDVVPAHTIEPFALSESLLRRYKINEGKNYVSLYSTSRKKEYAKIVLSNFFKKNQSLTFEEKINLAQKVKLRRPFFIVLKQRFQKLF